MLCTKAIESCPACNSQLPIASYQMLNVRVTTSGVICDTEERRLHYTMQTSQSHVTDNIAH